MDLIRNRPTGETCGPLRLPAGMLEVAVVGEIRRLSRAPEVAARTIKALREESSTIDEKAVVVERVTVGEDGITVDPRHEGLGSVLRDMMAPRQTETCA